MSTTHPLWRRQIYPPSACTQKATWKIQWSHPSEPPGTVSTEHGQIHRSAEVPAARHQPWCNGNGRPQSCPPNTNLRTSEEQNEKSEHPVDALGVRLLEVNKTCHLSPGWQDVCMGPGEGTLGSLGPAALKAPSIKLPCYFCVTSAAGLGDPALSSWCAKRAWSRIWFCIF